MRIEAYVFVEELHSFYIFHRNFPVFANLNQNPCGAKIHYFCCHHHTSKLYKITRYSLAKSMDLGLKLKSLAKCEYRILFRIRRKVNQIANRPHSGPLPFLTVFPSGIEWQMYEIFSFSIINDVIKNVVLFSLYCKFNLWMTSYWKYKNKIKNKATFIKNKSLTVWNYTLLLENIFFKIALIVWDHDENFSQSRVN